MRLAPGWVTDFYEERLARARALPEGERSFDVRQWLRQHEELEAALTALPEVPASATAQRPLVEPLGGDAALAVLLRLLAATYSEFPCDPDHLVAKLWCLQSQLPPFFRVWWHPGDKVGAAAGASPAARCLLALPACARKLEPRTKNLPCVI